MQVPRETKLLLLLYVAGIILGDVGLSLMALVSFRAFFPVFVGGCLSLFASAILGASADLRDWLRARKR